MSESLMDKLKDMNLFNNEVWNEYSPILQGVPDVKAAVKIYQSYLKLTKQNDDLARQNVDLAKQKDDIAKQKDDLADQVENLAGKLANINMHQEGAAAIPMGFVTSVSKASKDVHSRNEYYEKFLEKDPVCGGFIAHRMFVDFVKGARGCSRQEKGLEQFREKANGLVTALANRDDRSFLMDCQSDLESPQSLVASELLRMAVSSVKADQADIPTLFVSHQGEIKCNTIDSKNQLFGDKSADTSENKAKEKNLDYKVDIMATVISEGLMKIVATMEYKPDLKEGKARIAQRDMYATNTISLHKRPCIGVDIAGGNDVRRWKVTAMAYFMNPVEKTLFECSKMYDGDGLEALFCIARGLCWAAMEWHDDNNATEYRLGPVVGRHGDKVYKAYDNPTYRRPNLETVQEIFDPNATTWKSEDGKVTILETKYMKSDWKIPVSSTVFVDIANKLDTLHGQQKIHGDIRLANLLYRNDEGFIIDFDFVGHKMYPPGLKKLTLDGKRHEEVNKAIDDGTIKKLCMTAEHDRFSLGEVMRLFKCEGEWKSSWEAAIELCQGNSSLRGIANVLKEPFKVGVAIKLNRIFETGPTPKKRARHAESLESVGEQD